MSNVGLCYNQTKKGDAKGKHSVKNEKTTESQFST